MLKNLSITTFVWLVAASPLVCGANTQDLKNKLALLTADKSLSAQDVETLFQLAGAVIPPGDALLLSSAVTAPQGYTVDALALKAAQTAGLNQSLSAKEAKIVDSGKSFAGTAIPAAVQQVLTTARLAGAVAYDVADGEWNPYSPSTKATDNLRYEYTEITPEKLEADLGDKTTESNWITGYTDNGDGDATYTKKLGGTGNILTFYDHAQHSDVYARGTEGQKWADNCGFLSDGTLHCLPAARRWVGSDYILTNADLSRGQHMLYNGHIDVQAGVVVSVEMSGRISKKAGKGSYAFVDPIALLKAWGFHIAPGVSITFSNTADGQPVVDEATHTIRASGK